MNKQGPGKIEYLDYDWNVVRGCRHQETGVCNVDCYVPRNAIRFGIPKGEPRTPERIERVRREAMKPRFVESELGKPLRLKRPSRIGVCFTGDLFGSWVPLDWIINVLEVCRKAEQHRFLLLTKNPARYGEFEIPFNCWCGTSVTGGEAEQWNRACVLTQTAPRNRTFISWEPAIGSPVKACAGVKWLIIGGLTGKNARPANKVAVYPTLAIAWLYGVPVFIKSNAGYPEKIQQYPEDLRLEDVALPENVA